MFGFAILVALLLLWRLQGDACITAIFPQLLIHLFLAPPSFPPLDVLCALSFWAFWEFCSVSFVAFVFLMLLRFGFLGYHSPAIQPPVFCCYLLSHSWLCHFSGVLEVKEKEINAYVQTGVSMYSLILYICIYFLQWQCLTTLLKTVLEKIFLCYVSMSPIWLEWNLPLVQKLTYYRLPWY